MARVDLHRCAWAALGLALPACWNADCVSLGSDAETDSGATAADAAAALPHSGTFGTVRDGSSLEPIPGASVRFIVVDPGAEFEGLAQPDFAVATGHEPPGRYSYEANFPQGLVRVVVQASGYETLFAYRYHLYSEVCAGGPCARHDFELWPTGMVHDELPDLLPNPAYVEDSQIAVTNACDGRDEVSVCLRLTVGVANMSDGDLLLTATASDSAELEQHVFDSTGAVRQVPIGGSVTAHVGHDHVHLAPWATVLLRGIDESCDTLDTADRCAPIRQLEVSSTCLESSVRVDVDFIAARSYGCVITEDGLLEQGIGAGNMDIDNRDYLGQFLDVTGLAAGPYWLETVVNPDGLLLEADRTNNLVRGRLTLNLPTCGNGRVEFPESCEGDDLRGVTCEALGDQFVSGELGCNDSCGFDRSGCVRAPCEPVDVGSALGTIAEGDNSASYDSTDPERCATPRGTGRDVAFSWTAPETGRYNVRDGLGSLYVYVRDQSCDGPELGCATDLAPFGVDFDAEQGQTVVIVFDVLPERDGPYELDITGPL